MPANVLKTSIHFQVPSFQLYRGISAQYNYNKVLTLKSVAILSTYKYICIPITLSYANVFLAICMVSLYTQLSW